MIRQEEWMDINFMRRQGMSISQIARESGHTRKTVRRHLKSGDIPHYKKRQRRPAVLDPYKDTLVSLFRSGVENGVVLYEKISDMGYKEANYWERGVGGRARLSDWRRYVKTAGGGILIMNTVHNIDRLRYMLGYEATSVYARKGTFASASEVEDFISVSIGYDNGAIGYIESSSWAVGRSKDPSRIYGTEGQITLNPLRVYLNRKVGDYPEKEWFEPEVEEIRGGRAALAEDFVNAILSNTEPPITGEDGRKTLEIILAAYESSRTDMPIDLPLYY